MLKFITKEYPWGYTVWIETEYGKKQLASKLKSFDDISKFLDNKVIQVIK